MASFPKPTLAAWRALVEKDLAGVPFDKALVHDVAGVQIQPLYTDGPQRPPALVGTSHRVRICTHHERADTLADDIAGGVDGVWLAPTNDTERDAIGKALAGFRGEVLTDAQNVVSTLAHHAAGADAVLELALALAGTVQRLRADDDHLLVRIAVGRETFVELCKLRALRLCLSKVRAASGVSSDLTIHAVCSTRTLTERDAPVNMLRVTTQLFAAMLGGADWVTPMPFDAALGEPSEMARRIARNTALVLRDESHLDRVADPAGGAYFFEALTDQLARAAWDRFREIEKLGGLDAYVVSGALARDVEQTRAAREKRLLTRKEPIVGVSEFAALDDRPVVATRAFAGHRDAEVIERLRRRLEGSGTKVTLVTLGTPADSRARVAFAAALFAVGGLSTHEGADGEVACLCGSDEGYTSDGVERARQLKASGTKRLYLAGRPGPLEQALREAGIDDFVFLGCDVVAVLAPLATPLSS